MKRGEIQVRGATQSDRQRLANLIHFEEIVHRHLDWKSALDWIGSSPFLVAERGGSLIAALACPPDPPQFSWLRLFAATTGEPLDNLWQILWQDAQKELATIDIRMVYALALQDWFIELLNRMSYPSLQNVVVLACDPHTVHQATSTRQVYIRPMQDEDLPDVQELDRRAFSIEWRNSLDALRMALGQASDATVAEQGTRLVGYQISTSSPVGGHLARLAVDPNEQGKGIGTALVLNLLGSFQLLGVKRVTVNTQSDNQASLTIYRKCGFVPTGEVYPVFQLAV
jgi:ribosomal protein S18 acetylase RimI-like enzyme